MKIICIVLLLFTITSFAQTTTEKYNSYLKRYEYFDSRGTLIGYKQYNSYLNQWEYYKTGSGGYQIQQPQSSINIDLVQKTLNSKQSAYDNNVKSVQNTVKVIYRNIDYLVLKVITDDPKELDYKYANHIKSLFETKCVKVVEQKSYDFSSSSTTNMVNDWLIKNSVNILKQELNFMEDREHYNYLVNTYISLY